MENLGCSSNDVSHVGFVSVRVEMLLLMFNTFQCKCEMHGALLTHYPLIFNPQDRVATV